jgi:mannose-6-phosphate isomerase-like protein (cupin superfamily)
MRNVSVNLSRPYLVIPKVIEQPTWGGQYIVESKGWDKIDSLAEIKIGQSYELFSGSNLSLLSSSEDPEFSGELTDNREVTTPTQPPSSIGLRDLMAKSIEDTLGAEVIKERGAEFALLIKYTQALGNSFQVHIRDGVTHPVWKPKPESWYYFEPGLVTLGVKKDADWQKYQDAVEALQAYVLSVGEKVESGSLSYGQATQEIAQAIKAHDPWKYVNTVRVEKDQLVDLSSGGLHHSWEEDPDRAPLGNVLLELQAEAMDNISTFRSFDKGKIGQDGSIRNVQIKEYFEVIDRSPEINDPITHMRQAKPITNTAAYTLERLLETRHYNLEKLTLLSPSGSYSEKITRYKHLFVKEGRVEVTAADQSVTVTTAHSCFLPAAAQGYTIKNLAPKSEVLISY